MRRTVLALALVLAPGLAQAQGPLDPAIVRGAKRVAASYADTGMSGLGPLVKRCLREGQRRPRREKYAECAAVARAAITLDQIGMARFRMPALLDQKALLGKTRVAFLKHGGTEAELEMIHRRAAECL